MRLTGKNMERFVVILVAIVSAAVLLTAGNSSAASWPEKGKIFTMYMPSGAGGGSDMVARAFQPYLEEELGSKIVILVRPGGAGQVGTTEFLSKSGTDGYTTLLAVQLNTTAVYLNPERKAPYGRKDFQLIANVAHTAIALAVKKGSRYKSLKDLVEAARANPSKIKVTASGPMNAGDMAIYLLEKEAGVKFAHVIYDQQGEQRAALLGNHVDAESNPINELVPGQKSGEIETLAVWDSKESAFMPGIKTGEAQGYKVKMYAGWGLVYKSGTPAAIVNAMASAVQKATAKQDCQEKFKKMNLDMRVLVGKDYDAYWKATEDDVREILASVGTGKK